MKVTVVFDVENAADIEQIRRNVDQGAYIGPMPLPIPIFKYVIIKGVYNGDAIADVQELMDSSAEQSHDGILA